MSTTHTHRARRGLLPLHLAATLAVLTLVAACGDDEEATSTTTSSTAAPTTAAPTTGHGDHQDPGTVVIDGRDYAFGDVPATVPVGTTLGFHNSAAAELHEMVVFRIPDDEQAPIAELVARPADELGPLLGAPVAVLLQAPGSEDVITAVGDGVLHDPGRYALMCLIPLGADPQEYLEAAANSGGAAPTGVAGGPPHFTAGMFAELTATG